MRIADSSVLHRSLKGALPVAVRGSGVHLIDADGRDTIDACGGAAVSCLGHSCVIAKRRPRFRRRPNSRKS